MSIMITWDSQWGDYYMYNIIVSVAMITNQALTRWYHTVHIIKGWLSSCLMGFTYLYLCINEGGGGGRRDPDLEIPDLKTRNSEFPWLKIES